VISHIDLGETPYRRAWQLKQLLVDDQIKLAGNRKLKIYGILQCTSGKRMKAENRVFFTDEADAIQNGYRPCGHCMQLEYQNWKALN